MKTLRKMMIALMLTIVTSASAMTYSQAKDQALFLADKMAYELSLTDEQYEAAYEINLDYLMAVNDYNDVYGDYWARRNLEMRSILSSWQYDAYIAADYFYRPVYWSNNRWTWRIYTRYSTGRYYKSHPKTYTSYKGGHSRDYYTSRTWNKPTQQKVNNKKNNSRNDNTGFSIRTFGSGSSQTHNTMSSTPSVQNNNRQFGSRQSTQDSRNQTVTRQTTTTRQQQNNSSFGNRQSSPSRSNSSNSNSSKGSFGGHR